MSNYVKIVDFQAKDALLTGNPSKIIKGVEINDEFNAIQTAVATKADLASPAFTGNPSASTQASGNNSTRLATTAFVQQEINANEANVAITGGTITGVAITGGTITGLATVLAVADGGTGKSTLAVNNVLLGNGTSAIQEVAPGTSGNILTSNGTTWISQARPEGIGEGQTWVDVLASRANATNYTNNTSKPIMVNFGIASTNGFNKIRATVGGVLVASHDEVTPSSTSGGGSVSFIVPVGATYNITCSGTFSRLFWAELR